MPHATPPTLAATFVAGRRHLFWPLLGLTVAYAAFLVFATHYPKPEVLLGSSRGLSDKTLHFTAYAMLGLLSAATVAAARRWSWRNIAILMTGLAVAAGVDEITQPYFGRSADVYDWIYDLIGLAIGIAIVAVAYRLLAWPPRPRP